MIFKKQKRLLSLDAFRGMTIAAMILVNTPGSWSHIYAPLRHAEWHGWTPTDLIFPFFLFIVGVAITLSIQSRIGVNTINTIHKKIFKRSLIIFLLGLFLSSYPFGIPFTAEGWADFSFSSVTETILSVRIPGVLQRIALCYLATTLLVIHLNRREQYYVAGGLLMVYWAAMMLIPHSSGIRGDLSMEGNLARQIDLALFSTENIYSVKGIPFDPEGLLSTIPAIATTLSGVFVGNLLRSHYSPREKLIFLVFGGLVGIAMGTGLSIQIPINKQLWTPTYVLLTSGWACLILALFYWIMELKNKTRWAKPFIVFGSNSIFVFVASGILVRTILRIKIHYEDGTIRSLYSWLYHELFVPWAGDLNGSLFFATSWILLWLGVLWILYIKKIFIKI